MKLASIVIICHIIKLGLANTEFDKNLDEEWESWKKKYKKVYARSAIVAERRSNWESAHKLILKHNQEASFNKHSFTLAHNEFSDLTFDEFSQKFLINTQLTHTKTIKQSPRNLKKSTLPSEVDWKREGILNPVRSQGKCGACWAFAALVTLESQIAKLKKEKIRLSPQQLIDCDQGNKGCEGGMPERAFDYLIKYGAQTEASYEYTSSGMRQPVSAKCKYSRDKVVANMTSWKYTSSNSYTDEESLTSAIANVGPIAVAIKATPLFQYYSSGVFYDADCNKWKGGDTASKSTKRMPIINHAIIVIGYGSLKQAKTNNTAYYQILNTWGVNWGQNGYGLMSRNRENNCHIASFASYPII